VEGERHADVLVRPEAEADLRGRRVERDGLRLAEMERAAIAGADRHSHRGERAPEARIVLHLPGPLRAGEDHSLRREVVVEDVAADRDLVEAEHGLGPGEVVLCDALQRAGRLVFDAEPVQHRAEAADLLDTEQDRLDPVRILEAEEAHLADRYGEDELGGRLDIVALDRDGHLDRAVGAEPEADTARRRTLEGHALAVAGEEDPASAETEGGRGRGEPAAEAAVRRAGEVRSARAAILAAQAEREVLGRDGHARFQLLESERRDVLERAELDLGGRSSSAGGGEGQQDHREGRAHRGSPSCVARSMTRRGGGGEPKTTDASRASPPRGSACRSSRP
jgi:hypothetical protein